MAPCRSTTIALSSTGYGTASSPLGTNAARTNPNLAVLRFDAERAEIWLDASSLVAGIKMLLGADPKEDYKDKVAEVNLRR
jgi:hypothetical protein